MDFEIGTGSEQYAGTGGKHGSRLKVTKASKRKININFDEAPF